MTLKLTGRHVAITPALRDHAESKARKLEKYLDLLTNVEVVIDTCRTDHKKSCAVEMIAATRHRGRFVAKAAGDAYATLDACFRKLERLLSEEKQRLKNPKGLVSPRILAAGR